MSNTSFHFRHMFLLSACSSQSHATCWSLMSHYEINNKCNRVKKQHWRWLIMHYIIFCYLITCYMFSEATTIVLESFTNSTGKHPGVIEKNNLGISNVNTTAILYVLGYYTLYRLFTFRSKLDISLLFCFRLQY